MTKIKLSPVQIEILKLMRAGWPMAKSNKISYGYSYWLQKDGIGRGGETKYFKEPTFNFLLNNGFIALLKKSYPVSSYQLTELGKTIKL